MTQKIRALVVEDVKIAQKIAQIVLTNLGCNTDIAENGQQAILLFQENPYDIIFMDLGLPDIDGIETTKRIREVEQQKSHSLIVALTTHLEDSTKEKCLSAGMDDFMLKPLDSESAKKLLEKIVKHK